MAFIAAAMVLTVCNPGFAERGDPGRCRKGE
jgi:hypothetical protein